MKHTRWLIASLALVAAIALLWGLWTAWGLWQTQEARWSELARQRQTMQAALQEAQALQKKSVPGLTEAQSLIQNISSQRLAAPAVALPDASMQIQLIGVSPRQLGQGWDEIRTQTSATLVRADLTQGPMGWSGTLVFKLAQKP